MRLEEVDSIRFKESSHLHNIKVRSRAADVETTESYPEDLAKIINKSGHIKIISVDEIALYFEKIPAKNFIARKEKSTPGFK